MVFPHARESAAHSSVLGAPEFPTLVPGPLDCFSALKQISVFEILDPLAAQAQNTEQSNTGHNRAASVDPSFGLASRVPYRQSKYFEPR